MRFMHGCRHVEVAGHAGDAGARDCEGEEGEGGTRGKEGQEPEKDWVPTELISREIAFEGPSRVGLRRGAETGCELVWLTAAVLEPP
jgi:hypothetical protein